MALVKGQRAASEETGVPLSTVHYWYTDPAFAQLRTTAREEVAESMWAAAQVGVGEMLKGLQDPRTPLRDKTDATSMLSEKYLLLTGQATSRSETRTLSDDLSDDEKQRLRDWITALPATAGADRSTTG